MKKILSVVFLVAGLGWADQITLQNGDRFTGTILESDTKILHLKTEHEGKIEIEWANIVAITADGPLHIGLSDGQTVVGLVATNNSRITVTTQSAGVISTDKGSIQFMRNNDEQKAYETEIERYRNPRLVDLWAGFLDLGFAASHGNADTETFTLSANANRSTSRDKIEVYYTSIFASSDATGPSITTANSKRGGVSYNLNLNKKVFVFGSVDLESDQFQSLDLRFVPAGGLGYHIIATEPTQLDFRFGAAGDREFFSTGLNRNSAEVLLGEEFTHKFTKTTSINEKFTAFPNVSDSGYRMNFDTTATTSIRRWLSWQFTVSDRYLSNPVPGRKTNDILFSTGVRLSFAK